MKKLLCIILTSCTLILNITSYAQSTQMNEGEILEHYNKVTLEKMCTFDDTHIFPWAVEPIEELAKRGIVAGTGNRMFSPSNTVSRYEFIKMITGVCGIINKNAVAPYSDLSSDHWAYIYAASAFEAGMLDFYSPKILNGAAPILREEIAYLSVTAMIKSMCLEKTSKNTPEFTDTDKMSEYTIEAIATLNELGVINGRNDGSFCPKDYATRAEAAKIIYNILKIIENNF